MLLVLCLSLASVVIGQSCAVCCLGTGKCNNLATTLGSCCTRAETCCQLGSSSFPGAFTCCAAGATCDATGSFTPPVNKCSKSAAPILEVAAPQPTPPPFVPAASQTPLVEVKQTTVDTCSNCCMGLGQCTGLTGPRLTGSCCPAGTTCCLSGGSVAAFGAFTCCSSATVCTTNVKYSNTISTAAPGTCVARSNLLCRGYDVVTKSTTAGVSKVELRCGMGQKACPGISDFCDTTNYLPNDPLVGVCCRDVNSAVGCQQKQNCNDCTTANCYWDPETQYCNSNCVKSVLFSTTFELQDCITSNDKCGTSPVDTCARHCGEVTPNRFNKPPPSSLLSQGLETPKVAGQDMSAKKPATSTSYPGPAAILGKPVIGVAGCEYASTTTILDNQKCNNVGQIIINNPTIVDFQSCLNAVLAEKRCGPFFTSNSQTSCECLVQGDQCTGVKNMGTNVYSMECGGSKQPANYPYSAVTRPWENYVNSENGPYNNKPYDLTSQGGGTITTGKTNKGRRLNQWNPFWYFLLLT